MAEYPQSPAWNYSYIIEPEWDTLISKLEGQNEQRRSRAAYPVYNVRLNYNHVDKTAFQAIWAFYMARRGAAEAFHFYPVESDTYPEYSYVGIGDASNKIFDLPGKGVSSVSIYVNGVLSPSGYSILTGGGESNADRVEFTSAPAAGDVIECTFTGYLRIRCRFAQDKLTKEEMFKAMYKTAIELKGLAPV